MTPDPTAPEAASRDVPPPRSFPHRLLGVLSALAIAAIGAAFCYVLAEVLIPPAGSVETPAETPGALRGLLFVFSTLFLPGAVALALYPSTLLCRRAGQSIAVGREVFILAAAAFTCASVLVLGGL